MSIVHGPDRGSGRAGALAQHGVVLAAAVLQVLATPVATWWLVGDLSTVPLSAEPDYAFRPWPISAAVARAAGASSLMLSAAMTVLLVWATSARRLDVRWWAVLIPLLLIGMSAGAGWRVMTAGVIGANIGAGLIILVGGPAAASLALWSLVWSAYLLLHPRGRSRSR